MMSFIIRRDLAVYVMAICSTLVLLEFFLDIPALTPPVRTLSSWATTWASFAIVIGLISFVRYHYRFATDRTNEEWWLGWWTLFLCAVILVLGLTYGPANELYSWVWFMFNTWPYRTVTVLNSLYIMTAAYRAFRVRNIDSLVLMMGGFLTVIGMAPLVDRGGGVIPGILCG
jgi:uncharacterized membrane protein